MNYRIKAFIQNLTSNLPSPLDYEIYYLIQRRFGGLRTIDPFKGLKKSHRILELISKCGSSFEGKTFLDVGTGRTLNFLIGLWLCGVGKIYTVDLNPYLRKDLVFQSLDTLREDSHKIRDALPKFVDADILDDKVLSLMNFRGDLSDLLFHLGVEYYAPCDASELNLKEDSIDFIVSTNVFEHIPKPDLKAILLEARRLLNKDGLVVSIIDLSDHFSHCDASLSSINFLGLTERQHDKLSGNKFMYHNRLRASDYYKLFDDIGLKTLIKKENVDTSALELIESGFTVSKEFCDYDVKDLCVSCIHFVGKYS